jgi:hypothetical protein
MTTWTYWDYSKDSMIRWRPTWFEPFSNRFWGCTWMWRCVGCMPPKRTPPRRFASQKWWEEAAQSVGVLWCFFGGGSRVPSSGLQHISKAHQLSGDIAELLHKKLQKAVAVGCCGSRVFTGRFKRFSSRCQVSDPCWSYLIMVMCHLDFRWKNLEATCLFPAQPVIENVQQQTDITEILPSLN